MLYNDPTVDPNVDSVTTICYYKNNIIYNKAIMTIVIVYVVKWEKQSYVTFFSSHIRN